MLVSRVSVDRELTSSHNPIRKNYAAFMMDHTPPMTIRRPSIGVFDSGFGGLTVLKELVALAPDADYLYFGDTARLPYGSKSAETVAKYAIGAAHFWKSTARRCW